VFLFAGLFLLLSLGSYSPFDPSWNTASDVVRPDNLAGRVGAYLSDLLLQWLGLAAYAIPAFILMIGWHWLRSQEITSPWIKIFGAGLIIGSTATAFGLLGEWRPIAGTLSASGMLGLVLASYLVESFNETGAAMLTAVCWIIGLYFVSKFEMSMVARFFVRPALWLAALSERWSQWRKSRIEAAKKRAEERLIKPSVDLDAERARIALLKSLIRLQVASRVKIRS